MCIAYLQRSTSETTMFIRVAAPDLSTASAGISAENWKENGRSRSPGAVRFYLERLHLPRRDAAATGRYVGRKLTLLWI